VSRSLLERMVAQGKAAEPDWKVLPRLARKIARGEPLTDSERNRAVLVLLFAARFRTCDVAAYALELAGRGKSRKAAILEAMQAVGIDATDLRGERAVARAIERQKARTVAKTRQRAASRK